MLMSFRGCTTPQQIQNLKDSIEDNIDYLDGLDELPSELRLKVLKALEDGHVDDSDWRGVLTSLFAGGNIANFTRICHRIVQGVLDSVLQSQRRPKKTQTLQMMG